MLGDKYTRAGIEVLGGKGKVFVTGEVTSKTKVDVESVVRRVLKDVGYDASAYEVVNNIGMQSPDIAQGVDVGGAGDQGMMFGYACDSTKQLLPTAMVILQELSRYYDWLIRADSRFLADGKAQITGYYDENMCLKGIRDFTISYQNTEVDREATDKILKEKAEEICKKYDVKVENFLINPTGKFLIGGFDGDAGLCLNENTLISTISGLRKIKDLQKGMTVYTESGTAKITEVINNGIKNTKVVEDARGIEIEATLNHPFRVWDGEKIVWKYCGELNEGDTLVKRKVLHMNTHGKDTLDVVYSKLGIDIKIPFNEDFCYLLGWLVGDGNTTAEDRVTFYFGSDIEKEHIFECLKRCFPEDEIKYYECQGDRYYVLSKEFVKELGKIGISLVTSRLKEVPDSVLRTTDRNKYAFLMGLFDADGCIIDDTGRDGDYLSVNLVTASKKLAQQVSILLYSLGIQSNIDYRVGQAVGHISSSNGSYIKGNCDSYSIRIIGLNSIRLFLTKSGFRLSYKENKYKKKDFSSKWYINDAVNYNISKVLKPLLDKDKRKKEKYFSNYTNVEALKNDRPYLKENVDFILDMYSDMKGTPEYEYIKYLYDNFEFIKVKSIKDSKSLTYDISLDDETHSFIANGFIVHNTGRKIVVDAYQSFANVGGGAYCVDSETEYLTPTGWKKISNYIESDLVGQWNQGILEFVKPNAYICCKAKDMYNITTENHLDMVLSDKHDMVIETSKGNIIKKQVRDILDEEGNIKNGNTGFIPCYFNYLPTTEGLPLTDAEIRLQVAFCADGTILQDNRTYTGRIRVKRDKKKLRLDSLFNQTGLPYTVTEDGEFSIYWYNPTIVDKLLINCLQGVNGRQMKVIADEVIKWDGDEELGLFRTTHKEDADFVQFIFMAVYGKTSTIRIDDRVGELYGGAYIRKSICYEVSTCKHNKVCLRSGLNKEHKARINVSKFQPEDMLMYCFSVDSGMLVLRRNNNVFITGNSGKDPTKVDRSAAYKARQIAKEYLKKYDLKWCEVQLSYAIGKAKPLAIYIDSDKGYIEPEDSLYIECTPNRIIEDLGLRTCKYESTAMFGHYGNPSFSWE